MLKDLPVPCPEQNHVLRRSGSSKNANASQLQSAASEVGHSTATQAQGSNSLGQTSGAPEQLSQMQQLQLLAAADANQADLPSGAFTSGHSGLSSLIPQKGLRYSAGLATHAFDTMLQP